MFGVLSMVLARRQVHAGRRFSKGSPFLTKLSILSNKEATQFKSLEAFSKNENEEFMEHFPGIVNDLTANKDYSDIPDFTERLREVLHYVVPTGKKVRGLTTVITYKMLQKPENLTKENVKLANILGWCTELLLGSISIIDDIVDRSETRRNAPCWYKVQGVGDLALLDAIILENSLYFLLKKHFSLHPFYIPMVELFIDINLKTAVGQILDGTKPKIDEFTMERFNTIAKYKTGYVAFLFPVILGMYFSETFNVKLHQQVMPVLLEMGKYFQIKNDYNDIFGDPAVTGKQGTDIQEGKCTWMCVRALQLANSSQRKVLKEYYGHGGEKSVKAIMDLYKELNLPEEVNLYENQSYMSLREQIKQIPDEPLSKLLYILTQKLYKRETN